MAYLDMTIRKPHAPAELERKHLRCPTLDLLPSSAYMTATTSSILRIIPTHSVASLSALEFTSTGWITCSAYMSLMVPLRTLIPVQIKRCTGQFGVARRALSAGKMAVLQEQTNFVEDGEVARISVACAGTTSFSTRQSQATQKQAFKSACGVGWLTTRSSRS